jgi:hypothetical protein
LLKDAKFRHQFSSEFKNLILNFTTLKQDLHQLSQENKKKKKKKNKMMKQTKNET